MIFVCLIVLLIGILIGMGIRSHIGRDEKAVGVAEVDHNTGLCRFVIDKNDLSNSHCRKVVLRVKHDAVIPYDDSQ